MVSVADTIEQRIIYGRAVVHWVPVVPGHTFRPALCGHTPDPNIHTGWHPPRGVRMERECVKCVRVKLADA